MSKSITNNYYSLLVNSKGISQLTEKSFTQQPATNCAKCPLKCPKPYGDNIKSLV